MSVLQQLALSAPVEMVFPDAFEWTEAEEDSVLPLELRRKLTVDSCATANRIQGQMMNKVREWVRAAWQQQCRHMDIVLHPQQSSSATPVVVRGAQVRTCSGGSRGVGRGRGRQRTATELLGANWSESSIDVGNSSHHTIATQMSGRGHFFDMPGN